MIKVVLTNIPIKHWIVYPYVDGFLSGLGQALVLPPNDVEVVGCGVVSVCCICAWMGGVLLVASCTSPPESLMFPLCTPHLRQCPLMGNCI